MLGLIIFIHVTVCALLIIIIMIQRGHGGGLVESFSNLDSMFGSKTNTFLSRTTTVLASLFLFTCLVLAVFSARQSKSLMRNVKSKPPIPATIPEGKPQSEPQTQAQTPAQPEASKTE